MSATNPTLKDLRAQAANKRCFDCQTGVSTYANMTVNTFICQTCAGLLRQLQHRTKSLSVASFTNAEIAALARGGNECAGQLWRRGNAAEAMPPAGLSDASLKRHMELTYVAKKWFNPAAPTNPANAKGNDEDDDDDNANANELPAVAQTPLSAAKPADPLSFSFDAAFQ